MLPAVSQARMWMRCPPASVMGSGSFSTSAHPAPSAIFSSFTRTSQTTSSMASRSSKDSVRERIIKSPAREGLSGEIEVPLAMISGMMVGPIPSEMVIVQSSVT